MDGQPVWLASLSRRDRKGKIIATEHWARSMRYHRMLRTVLEGVGDQTRERLFRMNVTLCLHRACTDKEVRGLPDSWQKDLSGMAGGPLEVLWSSVQTSPSCLPCENPEQIIIDKSRKDLWVPGDCGKCGPCLARAEKRMSW